MKIVISPYSRKLRNGNNNPKNYPWWQKVIDGLQEHHVIQIGINGEESFTGVELKFNLKLKDIIQLINECDIWISVDNFLQHLASHTDKRGIVIWGRSDPNIFGYPHNTNILKDKKYLRPDQYNIWESIEYIKNVFVKPEIVLEHIYKYM
jgi:ADP-heptose:LPS heptosyltransferase